MTENMSMYLCLAILQNPYTSFNIWHLRNLNMSRITGLLHTIDQDSNTTIQNWTYQPYTQLVHNESNKSWAPFYIIPEKLIPPCSLPLKNLHTTIKTYCQHYHQMKLTARLYSNLPWSLHLIIRKWHNPAWRNQCRIPSPYQFP